MKILDTKKYWFTFSGVLIAISLVAIGLWQFKYGIDFTGGTLVTYRFEKEVSVSELTKTVAQAVPNVVVSIQQTPEGANLVRLPTVTDDDHARLTAAVIEAHGGVEEGFENIGPTVGKELREKAVSSLIIVFIGILVYMAIAFRRVTRPVSSWVYGAITILTAFHDVIIPLGLFAILGRFGNVVVDSAFVAAILTIMGYSINDTIVVLDRVRENLIRTDGTFTEIVERSVHQSFARSLNTTATTLLALIAIYFFGGESLRYFSLALIAGIATGAYSSLFIAAPLLVVWERYKVKGS